MTLNTYNSRHQVLLDWVLSCTPDGASVLDVGCGNGAFCPELACLRERGFRISGVDPDSAKLMQNQHVQCKYVGLLETAAIPAGAFDCLIALFVFEHIDRPSAFLKAAYSALKPGGSLFFITPNARHYFTAFAKLSGRLGLQEAILNRVRPRALAEAYHYPAYYKINAAGVIGAQARQQGFRDVEFRYCEAVSELVCYLPVGFKWIAPAWEVLCRSVLDDSYLLNLMGRMTK